MPPEPLRILDSCARRALRDGLAPPAAFLGDWLGAAAVIAPSVLLEPVDPQDAFAAPSAGWTVGFRSFPDVPDATDRLLPEAVSGISDGLLVLGHDGRWSTWGTVFGPEELELEPELESGAAPEEKPEEKNDDEASAPRWSTPDRDAHRTAVMECLKAIRAGEIYQACVSTRLDGVLDDDPLAMFSALWRGTQAQRASYLAGSWGAVVSLSPETYLTRCGHDVRSSPIKGTLPRAADPALLRSSVKDVAENIMIVDLVRHDLGISAEIGSVSVPELLTIREAPGVWHLVSTVASRTEVTHSELVDSTFPPASVTGTPKLRARELIAGWESRARGLHCGALGITGPDHLDLSVAIRTLEIAPDGRCEFGVGGGITIDSDPDAEWDECVHKAAFTWGGGPPPWERG